MPASILPHFHAILIQIIILCKTFLDFLEKSFCRPFLKIAMNTAGTAVFPGERLPVNSRPQDINYGFKNLSGIHWFSASSLPALICFGFITFHFRFAIRFLHAILFLLTEYDALSHLIDSHFINQEESAPVFY